MNKKEHKIDQLYNYLRDNIVLTKAQIESRLKLLIEDEEQTYKFISYLVFHNVTNKLEPKQIIKLTDKIITPKYVRLLLRYNLPYDRNRLLNILYKNKDEAIIALMNQQFDHIEYENLLNSILEDNYAAITLLGVQIKFDKKYIPLILNKYDNIKDAIQNVEKDYSYYYFKGKDGQKYTDLIIKAKTYLEFLKNEI